MLGRKVTTGGCGREAASRRNGPESYWNSNERPPDPDKKETRRRSGAELPPRRRLGHVAAAGGPAGAVLPARPPHPLRAQRTLWVWPGRLRSARPPVGGGTDPGAH